MNTDKEGADKIMKRTIFYYTGTGNSLWVAKTLAQELGDTELLSIADWAPGRNGVNAKVIGLVFPVHIWGLPGRIIQFVNQLKGRQPDYVFAIAVNAGQVANTLVQLKNILAQRGLKLSTGFEIKMPSNYIPWGGPGPKQKHNRRFEMAKIKISKIATAINGQNNDLIEKGPLWQRLLFTIFYKMLFSYVPKMDRKFWVDEKCNQCAICGKVCPSANITFQEGKPVWNHRCEQCFACLQWCPKEAIQYGKRTAKYERYHHPAIQVKDVLKTGLSLE
jgi:ferredoxin